MSFGQIIKYQFMETGICFANFLMNIFPDDWISSYITRPIIARLFGLHGGKRVMIRKKVYFSYLKNIYLGKHVRINRFSYFDGFAQITLGDYVAIGFNVSLATGTHEIGTGEGKGRAGKLEGKPIVIEDGCWIGAGAVIGPGVTIGMKSIVAAGAVVLRSMPPNSVIAGNPARVIQKLDQHTEEKKT